MTAPAYRPWTLSWGYNVLLVPPCLFLLAFFAWPLVRVVARGFTDPELGISHYLRVFDVDGPYLQVLWNTVETASVVALLCLLVGYPLAYVVARAEGTRLRVMMGCVLVALWTSAVVRSYAWMIVFQRKGVLNDFLVSTTMIDRPINFLPGSLAVHVGMVHIMLPFMVLPLIATMRGIDPTLVRAADILGARPLRTFWHVFLPLSKPGITAGLALVFMTSLGFYITPALLGGPRHLMAAVLIEQQANGLLNWGFASALSTTLLLMTVGIYLLYLRATGSGGGVTAGR